MGGKTVVPFVQGSWTVWLNGWDAVFNYRCPNGGAVSGLESKHDNGKEDRLFQVRCSEPQTHLISYESERAQGGWKNDWDGPMNWQCTGMVAGVSYMHSEHSNEKEDRRWKYGCRTYCPKCGSDYYRTSCGSDGECRKCSNLKCPSDQYRVGSCSGASNGYS